MTHASTDVALVGAGPIGLEVAVALKKAGLDYVHFDAGQIGETIRRFPPNMRFYSSPERIAIAGVPIQTVDQQRLTREQYLAYLRAVVLQFNLHVRTYERVLGIRRHNDGFLITTRSNAGQHLTHARRLILATGGTARPRRLGIPGEDLPHVSHDFQDPHVYFRRRLLVVGGKNSAVEAAVRCFHAAVDVTIAYRGADFPSSVKYWLAPEIRMLIETGRVRAHFRTVPVEITPTHVTLQHVETGERIDVPADFVLLAIGYEADVSLFEMAGVGLHGEARKPVFDEKTMETDVPGVYVAGTATAGTQTRFGVFLENCHVHAARIVAALQGQAPPEPPSPPNRELET